VFVVDTNVLLYATEVSCQEHDRCHALLQTWRRQAEPWFITWGILYEFLRVVTHPRVYRSPMQANEAWLAVESLLASPALTVLGHTPRHSQVARLTISEVPALRGNLFHDLHTAILMREHGVRRIYTRDADFHRFPFLEVIDPLAAG
jgi:toxin-antitoxin system PIN domain toxin